MSLEAIKPKTEQDKNKTRQDSQTRLLFSMPEVGEHSILLIFNYIGTVNFNNTYIS
jgi:ERCC4-type nuclease